MSAFSAAAQDEDGDITKTLQARVADLEAQLYAVGAGGVGSPVARQDHPEQHLDMVPEGWKLVPVEPADSQIRAAQDTWWYACNCETYWDQIYAAMIAAAPQPPVVEQPQVEQEPVAYYVMNGAALFQLFRSKSQADALANDLQKRHDLSGSLAHFHVVPLHTHPQPKREPLTDAQINGHRLALPYDGGDLPDPWDFKQGVRAAERAHRIGGEA